MYYEAETQFHEWLGATLPQHLPETGQMFFYSPAPVQNLRGKQEQIRCRHHSQPQRRGFALSFWKSGAFQDVKVKPVNAIRRQQDRHNHNQKRRRIFKGVEAKAVTDRLQRIRFMGACNHKRSE